MPFWRQIIVPAATSTGFFNRPRFFLPTKKPPNLSIQGLDLSLSGSTTWTRTRDPVINSHLLYQLSYRGMTRMLLIGKEKSSLCRQMVQSR